MSLNLQLTAVTFIFFVLLSIFYLLRKGKITIKYSLIWIFTSLILLFFTIFPSLMIYITRILGFNVGSNMIFAGLIAMLLIINLSLTVIISSQNSKIRLLIQEVSIIKGSINEKK